MADTPEYRDPDVDGEDAARGLKISRVPFEELVRVFPDTTHVSGCARYLVTEGLSWNIDSRARP